MCTPLVLRFRSRRSGVAVDAYKGARAFPVGRGQLPRFGWSIRPPEPTPLFGKALPTQLLRQGLIGNRLLYALAIVLIQP